MLATSTFSVRLPFNTDIFSRGSDFYCLYDHKLQCCMLRSNTIYTTVIQYKIQEISSKSRNQYITSLGVCLL